VVLLSQYMYTLTLLFDNTLSLCTEDTALSVQHALTRCPDVLEFVGCKSNSLTV
jgi:hypothetical protein